MVRRCLQSIHGLAGIVSMLLHLGSKQPVLCHNRRFIIRHRKEGPIPLQASVGTHGPARELQILCQEGQLDKALDVLVRMDQGGACAASVNLFVLLLKECAKRKALLQAKLVYAHMTKRTLESTTFLGECMVSTMVKCGGLEDAIQVFHRLPHPTVYSWTALISGCTVAGQEQEAMRLYGLMRQNGLEPNKYTLVSLCRACGSLADLAGGKRIHAEAQKYRLESDLFVGTCIVDMFVKCGSIPDAQTVFDGLSQRNVVSWTAMLTAYAQQGQPDKALQLFEQMHVEGVSPDERAFVSAVQACGLLSEREKQVNVDGTWLKIASLQRGKAIHANAQMKGYDSDVFVGNTLISMYGKCGGIAEARKVFSDLPHCDVVSWNAMLAAYTQQSLPHEVFLLYEQMLEECGSPNDRTLVSILQACGMHAEKDKESGVDMNGHFANVKSVSLYKGKAIHADAWEKGYRSDLFIGSVLVSMYGKCGSLVDAQNVFDGLLRRTTVLWNALLAAHVELGKAEQTLQLYDRMRDEGTSPDDCTFVSMLQACCILAEKEEDNAVDGRPMKMTSLQKGKAVHAGARSKGYGLDSIVGSTLISLYGKCGSNLDAQTVFGGLLRQSVVEWNSMLAAYALQGQTAEAFELFKRMQEGLIRPDDITLVSVLQSCSNGGSLHICRQVHNNLVQSGGNLSALLATTLIHAYGRCASMVEAQDVFDALARPDVVSWNALIAGYARQGNCAASLQCFEKMQVAGERPDGVTFLSVVSACSHAGLVGVGVECFESMIRDYGMTPGIEHYVCMVDLLGRAGHFSKVADLFSSMPLPPNLSIWLSLLAACRQHGKVVPGKQAFDSAVDLDPMDPSPYILMSNIYADAGLWQCAKDVKELGQKRGAWKNLPGQSWIEHEQELCGYTAGDTGKHPEVFALLEKVNECV